MMNKETITKQYLYVINLNNKMVKVGLTCNLRKRIAILSKEWGEFNLDDSFYHIIDSDKVFEVEQLIHSAISEYRVKLPEDKDGHSEFFELKKLHTIKKILKYLRHFGVSEQMSFIKENKPKINTQSPIKKTQIKELNQKELENEYQINKIMKLFKILSIFDSIVSYDTKNKKIVLGNISLKEKKSNLLLNSFIDINNKDKKLFDISVDKGVYYLNNIHLDLLKPFLKFNKIKESTPFYEIPNIIKYYSIKNYGKL
jgi:hypothetical protein